MDIEIAFLNVKTDIDIYIKFLPKWKAMGLIDDEVALLL
jgi:hypothetical protein